MNVAIDGVLWLDEIWVNPGCSAIHIWTDESPKGIMRILVNEHIDFTASGIAEGFICGAKILFVLRGFNNFIIKKMLGIIIVKCHINICAVVQNSICPIESLIVLVMEKCILSQCKTR